MARLSLSLLGPLHITLDGRAVSGFTYNKARALLTYLAVESDRPHHRDALVGLFWPGLSDTAARTNLRQALAKLRETLGDTSTTQPFLLTTRDTVQLDPASDFSLDVSAVETCLTECRTHVHRGLDRCQPCAARMEQAIRLYRGDFLAEFSLADSTPFEEWAQLKRERLRQQALELLAYQAVFQERQGAFDLAAQYARRQIELDSWHEEAHRQLMRLLDRAGQRNMALAQYETCKRVLAEGLGVAPARETTELYEIIRDGLEVSSIDTRHSRLPAPPTPLIGREQELQTLAALIANPNCRLITIAGPGGSGKTRLALEVAHQEGSGFRQGAILINLAPLNTAELIAPTILTSLGVSLRDQQEPVSRLLDYLQDQELLLVLDNFEHLLAGITLLIGIIEHAPNVTLLVTSRERLALRAEWLAELQGLDYPHEMVSQSLEAYSAVNLFVQRARQVQPQFKLTGSEAQAVVSICQQVEGLPLAIELAAASIPYRSCAEIADEIESGLQVLSATTRDLPERHRSLRATFEYSWRLLSEEEQCTIRRLAVFRGGCSEMDAEHIAGATPATLIALQNKFLLRRPLADRYDMHELLRQYAREKLVEAAEEDLIRAQHIAYFVQRVENANAALLSSEQLVWLERLELDHDNFRAALDWASNRMSDSFILLSGALWRFWYMRGYLREGQRWLQQAIGLPGPMAARARVLRGAAGLAWHRGDFGVAQALAAKSVTLWRELNNLVGLSEALIVFGMAIGYQGEHTQAQSAFEESLALARKSADPWSLAMALFYSADIDASSGPIELLRTRLEQSLSLFRQLGDRWGLALPLHGLGYMAYHLGDYATARKWLEEALQVRREIGDRWLMALTLNVLGEVARCEANHLQAESFYRQSLALFRELDSPGRVAMELHNLAYSMQQRGEQPQARQLFAESLTTFKQLGDWWGVAACLEGLAGVLRDAQRAVGVLGAAEFLRETIQANQMPADRIEYNRVLAKLRTQLTDTDFAVAWANGRAMTRRQAIAFALESEDPLSTSKAKSVE
jgi:predicted ATPase/DNA-binding SARP family transcriptional activator